MTTESVDKINILLVVVAFVAAVLLPFELFLFSYAFLGPLHYLTEINWLQKRSYFVSNKRNWIWVLVLMVLLMSINTMFGFLDAPGLKEVGTSIAAYTSQIMLASFLFAISLVVFRKLAYILLSIPVAILLSWALHTVVPLSTIIIGSFVPTLIHVYIFTIFFMAYGAIKSKSRYGLYGIIAMLLVPFAIYLIDIAPGRHGLVGNVEKAYVESGFAQVNATLAGMFGWIEGRNFDIISQIGLKIQIFVAFAYTYHYLNWFSKTSVIGWKQALNRRSTILILVIWLASVGIYMYDYKTGLTALFFLSFLHVLLEFPLNFISIREVFLAFRFSPKTTFHVH
jgi:hypothetical protein